MRVTRTAVLTAGVLALAGCGGGAKSPSVANVGTVSSPTTTQASASQLQQGLLKYSECMRANGGPNFPDPSPGGGFQFSAGSGIDPSSPAMKAAQATCRKLLPAGGPPSGPTHPAAQ